MTDETHPIDADDRRPAGLVRTIGTPIQASERARQVALGRRVMAKNRDVLRKLAR